MFYTIYNTQSGALLDITFLLPDALPPEYSVKGFDSEIPDLYYHNWDTATRLFVANINVGRWISTYQFMNLFTAIERIAIKTEAKLNPALSDYMDMLGSAPRVLLDDPMIYGGLYYLTMLGLIIPGRIPEILA